MGRPKVSPRVWVQNCTLLDTFYNLTRSLHTKCVLITMCYFLHKMQNVRIYTKCIKVHFRAFAAHSKMQFMHKSQNCKVTLQKLILATNHSNGLQRVYRIFGEKLYAAIGIWQRTAPVVPRTLTQVRQEIPAPAEHENRRQRRWRGNFPRFCLCYPAGA